MVQPALMTALKTESVGRPPGVPTMTLTADNKVNGNLNLIDNSSSHLGANSTGRAEAGDAALAPTIITNKKLRSQTRLPSHEGNKKA